MSSTAPCSTMRPRYITATSSQICATTPMLCVMNITAIPVCSWSLRIRSRIWASVVTSRAVVGSSAISSAGLQESAIAIMAR